MQPDSSPSPSPLLPAWPYPNVLAHRGAGVFAPENTLAALRGGAQLGHRMVEFDVKLSADNISFLLHDDTLERTTNGHGAAANVCYSELATLDAGSWFAREFASEILPTLAATAQTCQQLGLTVNIEIKPCPGREALTGRQVAQDTLNYWNTAHEKRDGCASEIPPLLSSFSVEALAAARAVAPRLPRGLLFKQLPADWQTQAAALGCTSIHVAHSYLSRHQVMAIHNAGFRVLAYTVNDLQQAQQLLGWGVDTLCTDQIELIRPGLTTLKTISHA